MKSIWPAQDRVAITHPAGKEGSLQGPGGAPYLTTVASNANDAVARKLSGNSRV